MDILFLCLILFLAVVGSGWISRAMPIGIPLPIVQILIGAGIALWTNFHVQIEPGLFFALFIPALLYLDGWRIPKDDLERDGKAVLGMAVGLVFLTVIGLGFAINWMLPTIPLPVAFALAAILSPTDPVAVSAITSRLPMPKRLLHLLEGEALLNDASGLSAFRLAVAAMVIGHFSFQEAVSEFVAMSMGGALAGVMVCWLIISGQSLMARHVGEDNGSKVLVSILIPFAAYFAAETFHFSGILAAATAGIYMAFAEMKVRSGASARMQRNSVWDMLAFTMNGIIFVLLGEQFPKIISGAAGVMREAGATEVWMLGVYVLAITAMLLGLRFAWTGLTFWVMHKNATMPEGVEKPAYSLRGAAIATAAGVRGSITLAGIMTLPHVISDGSQFPARDLAIFLAAGVIVTTMIFASFTLPFLLRDGARHVLPEDAKQKEEDEARVTAAEAAIRGIEAKAHILAKGTDDPEACIEAAARVVETYRKRIERIGEGNDVATDGSAMQELERQLALAGLEAERSALFKLGQSRKLSDAAVRKLVHPIDLSETRLGAE